MLTIQDIRTIVFRLPLRSALKWGKHGVMNEAVHVLVEVELSNGAIGVAEGLPRPTIYGETPHSIVSVIEHELKPRVIGEAADPQHIYPLLQQVKNNQTAKGLSMSPFTTHWHSRRGNRWRIISVAHGRKSKSAIFWV